MEEDLELFLRKRDIDETIISDMKYQKISMETIRVMEVDLLEKYLPKIGDRLAVLDYCTKELSENKYHRKHSLLEKLRNKLQTNKFELPEGKKTNFVAKKKTRVIEIGWIHFEKDRYTQIRTKHGGGTRKISVDRNANSEDILKVGKTLFFPYGMSKKGHVSEFDFSLTDFKYQELTSEQSVSEMFQISGLTKLRCYISTRKKTAPSTAVCDSPIINKELEKSKEVCDSRNSSASGSSLEYENISSNGRGVTLSDVPIDQDQQDPEKEDIVSQAVKKSKLSLTPSLYILSDDESEKSLSNSQSRNDEENILYSSVLLESLFESNEHGLLEANTYKLILHRGNVLDEMISSFTYIQLESVLEIEIYLPNGEKENAEDIGGVFRDVLSEFWIDFFNKYTVGTKAKVPVVRHDLNAQKWHSVAKIIVKGFKDVGYFPTSFAKTFLEMCLFKTNYSDFTQDLLNYVAPMDAKVLNAAKYDFNAVDYNELLESLDNIDCKWKPTENNFAELIEDLAHQELIQKPAFIIDNWSSLLCNLMTKDELAKIYEDQTDMTKNILKSFIFEENLAAEKQTVANYLKKFIRESDDNLLKKFLRFVTGADMVLGKEIKVVFSNENCNFTRTPTSQTCGCLLNLPQNYPSYPDFRNEFKNLLESNIWVMDKNMFLL